MKVRDLLKKLEGKENYDLTIDYYEIESIIIDEEEETVVLSYNEDDEDNKEFYDDYYDDEPEIEEYLQEFDTDDLILLAKKLNITCDFDDMTDEELIDTILKIDKDKISDVCEDLFDYTYDDFKDDYEMNNAWRHSDYESKDIDDWDVDDHLAAWYDHMMEK